MTVYYHRYYHHPIILENKMDYQIVREYMMRKYPSAIYNMAKGNDCVWVSFNNLSMYFIIRDNKIVDIQVD